MYQNPSNLLEQLGQVGVSVRGTGGAARVRAGLSKLQALGLISNPADHGQIKAALSMLPGPFGAGNPNTEIGPFLDYAEQFADNFDPVGLPGGRFLGRGVTDDPRNDYEQGRENCDLFGLVSSDVAAGSTGANSTFTISAVDVAYRNAVLWLWTAGGKVRNITEIKIDSRPFYLGPSNSIPADACDITLEPHPMRQGIYLGSVTKSLSVTAYIETSATAVHVELLLDAEIAEQAMIRPGARILRHWRQG